MRHDGYDSDGAVSTKGRRRRRSKEICQSFACVSPWFIFLRWFNGGKSRNPRNRFVEKMEGNLDVKRKSGKISSSSRKDVSEIGKEASFNLGIGLGLIYLVRNELHKMVELRKRIELLLQNFDTEIENQDKKQRYTPSRCSISSSYSRTRVEEIMYDEEHDPDQSVSPHDVERPQIVFGSNRFRREKSLRMDQLEAELEVEFDRMQHHIDGEFFLYSQQQCPEVNMEDSVHEVFEEVSELHEWSNEFYGISPRDLEGKLHEVLEARQQERINELESALEFAMQQLDEKERELSCWKDAARLVSQHLPFIPVLLRHAKEAMEREFEVTQTGQSLMKNSIYKCNIQAI